MHKINLDKAEQKVCHDYFDELWIGGKPEKLKKVVPSIVYRTNKLEEGEEEVEGILLGD